MSTQAWSNWCRMCTEKADGPKIELDLEDVIRRFFIIDLDDSNAAPKNICKECNVFLNSLLKFSERCARAQAFYYGLDFSLKYTPDANLDPNEIKIKFGIGEDNKNVVKRESTVGKRITSRKKLNAIEPIVKINDCDDDDDDDDVDGDLPQTEFLKVEEVKDIYGNGKFEQEMTFLPSEAPLPMSTTENFPCPVCSRTFISDECMQVHFRQNHSEGRDEGYPCPKCAKSFTTEDYFKLHWRDVHLDNKDIVCEQCGKCFKMRHQYNRHVKNHLTECPYKCTICGKGFKVKNELKVHYDVHAGKTWDCKICGLKLKTRQTYYRHQLVHSDVRKHACKLCDSAFKLQKSLKRHMESHAGIRYPCRFCGQSFAASYKCRKHESTLHKDEMDAMHNPEMQANHDEQRSYDSSAERKDAIVPLPPQQQLQQPTIAVPQQQLEAVPPTFPAFWFKS